MSTNPNIESNKSNESKEPIHKVIIIGAGCAGLTAGIYAGRAGLEPIIFSGKMSDKGGLLTKTSIVENYPGFPTGILGYDLMENMESQSKNCGAKIIDREIIKVEINNNTNKIRQFILTDDNNDKYISFSVIIATGSKPNKLGLKNEDKYWAKGISSCAVCDGALYRNKNIVVVGGGESAIEEAVFLTKYSNVTLIHRRDKFRASKVMQDKVLNNNKIKIIYDTIITEINGNNKLNSITIQNVKTNQKEEIKVDGLFYGLGLTPNTKLFKDLVKIDEDGYIMKDNDNKEYNTMTSIEGIFVAGDVHDKKYRQAVIACGDGCMASLDVNNYLESFKSSI